MPRRLQAEVELRGIELPPRQRRAIREEPLGTNAKIQMQFSRRVWNADHWTGNLYTDGIVQGGWETTVDQPGAPGILIALPGGDTGADLGRRYRLRSYEGPAHGQAHSRAAGRAGNPARDPGGPDRGG